MDMYIEPLT